MRCSALFQLPVGFICLFDDLLRFFAGKALLSLELELFELAVLFLWVHNRTLNNGSGGCWADRLVSPHRCDVTAHTSGVRSAHLALHVLLLAPLSDLFPLLRTAIAFEPVGSPADDVDVAFDVPKRGDEFVEAW